MTNEQFIQLHRTDDTRVLALRKVPEGVDISWCLQQIEGWQLARKKLPQWAKESTRYRSTTLGDASHVVQKKVQSTKLKVESTREGEERVGQIWFPPRLSMEQCSSEQTAQYKRKLFDECEEFYDFTGGFGIDFSYMSEGGRKAFYIEQQEQLCKIARQNFPLLGLRNAEVINGHAKEVLSALTNLPSGNTLRRVFFLDPARRDDVGRKVAALEDCTPNVIELLPELLSKADLVILKLSPMLDITQAIRQLDAVRQVHVVSVQGECKEVLLVLSSQSSKIGSGPIFDAAINEERQTRQGITYHCVNLGTEDSEFCCSEQERNIKATLWKGELQPGMLLFEPNASILKASVQDAVCLRYGLQKLHPLSNLFVCAKGGTQGAADSLLASSAVLPGRSFIIEAISDFSKAGLKELLKEVRQANLTIRNFPSTVAELRKRLKLKEGGDIYLFATTLADGQHVLIKAKKMQHGRIKQEKNA